jgi:cell division protein FtsL
MFRPLTVIAITAFCVVGWNVYRAEDSARQLDREARELTRKIDQARERTQVLRAEWALLNEPERLRQVAQKHLPLETMTPAQFVRLAELDRRMPGAVAFAGPVSLFGPAPGQQPTAIAGATPQADTAAAPVVVAASPARPATTAPAPHPAPVVVAAAPARPAPRPEVTRTETARTEATRAPVTLAANRVEEPRRRVAPPAPAPVAQQRPQAIALREAPPREQVAEVRPASTSLLRQALHLPISTANAAPLPRAGGSALGGSALGGSALGGVDRGTLAPPVPLPVPVPVR